MSKQTRNIIIAASTFVILVVIGIVCWITFGPKPQKGAKNIVVEVVHKDKTKKTFKINTDAVYLRGALDEKKLVAGDESEYGLFVKTVDGETVSDDSAAQEWWCFTKSGESLMTGVDTTPISDGDKYEITFTVGW